MDRRRLLLIVEGHGETEALALLARRWFWERAAYDIEVDRPIRAGGKGALTSPYDSKHEFGVEYYVEIAARRRHDALLILLDADDDCPMNLGRDLLVRAAARLPKGWPIGVVAANRMYETWFLAALASGAFRQELVQRWNRAPAAEIPDFGEVEMVVDCKGRVSTHVLGGIPYEPTIHQVELSSILPFDEATTSRSRSFRKLLKELDQLLQAARRRGAV